MVQINLNSQCYKFKIVEGKVQPQPGNEGGLANNAKATSQSIWDQTNYLKTHSDCKTKENVSMLIDYAQAVAQAAKSDKHIPSDVGSQTERALGILKGLK